MLLKKMTACEMCAYQRVVSKLFCSLSGRTRSHKRTLPFKSLIIIKSLSVSTPVALSNLPHSISVFELSHFFFGISGFVKSGTLDFVVIMNKERK